MTTPDAIRSLPPGPAFDVALRNLDPILSAVPFGPDTPRWSTDPGVAGKLLVEAQHRGWGSNVRGLTSGWVVNIRGQHYYSESFPEAVSKAFALAVLAEQLPKE
jgi:hypothetical protein